MSLAISGTQSDLVNRFGTHFASLLGFDRFDSVYPCRLLSLIILSHPPNCEQSGCLRFHQQFLKLLNCSCLAALAGSIDSLLDAEHVLLEFSPRQLVPSLTDRRSGFALILGAFLSFI
jgi:hypothetical protein